MFEAGDDVYVTSMHQRISKAKITRVTKTLAIIEYGRYDERFRRDSGRRTGGSGWDSTRIEHPTERLDAEYLQERIRKRVLRLVDAARDGNATSIRTAYAHWDELARENTKEQG